MFSYRAAELVGNTKKLSKKEQDFYSVASALVTQDGCKSHVYEKYYEELKSIFPVFPSPWLADKNSEQPQSYLEWKSLTSWNRFSSWSQFNRWRNRKIYILPIGPMPETLLRPFHCGSMITLEDILKQFLEIFFLGCSVYFLPQVEFREIQCRTRIHTCSHQLQLLLTDVNDFLQRSRPKDAFCLCAFSWFDFYPGESFNHILGEGSMLAGTAAFSFGHYAMFKEQERLKAKAKSHESACIEKTVESLERRTVSDGISPDSPNSDFIYVTFDNPVTHERVHDGEFLCRITTSSSVSAEPDKDVSFEDVCEPELVEDETSIQFASKTMSENPWLNVFQAAPASGDSSDTNDEFEVISAESLCAKACHTSCDTIDSTGNLVLTALPPKCSFTKSCKIIRRLFRVMSHEICHVFGLSHCFFYKCTMNSSTSVEHADSQPLLLCPLCLRKLHKALNFSLLQRYKRMEGFLENLIKHCPVLRSNLISLSRDSQVSVSSDPKKCNSDSKDFECLFATDIRTIDVLIGLL